MKLAGLINERVDELARIEALDVGKPLKQGRADALAMARYMEFYAGAADKVMGETIPYLDGYTVYTLREPHGVTGPYRAVELSDADRRAHHRRGARDGQRLRAQARGGSLPHFARACRSRARGGLSRRRAQRRPGPRRRGGRGARRPSRRAGISPSPARSLSGALVQEAAARHVAPVTLELGGKSPQLVFADADLERALPFLVNAGIQNAGQTCSAASRILVERKIYGEVVERMAARYKALKVGPADADLDVGPLISERQKSIVSRFIAEGADLKMAADRPDRRGRAAGRTLCRPDPVRRCRARPSPGAGGNLRPRPGRHSLR